jgi:hypothetical protein
MLLYPVFNATFNNISGISWQSVLLVEETGVPGEPPPPPEHKSMIEQDVCRFRGRL